MLLLTSGNGDQCLTFFNCNNNDLPRSCWEDKDSVNGTALVRISSQQSLPLIAVVHTEQRTVNNHVDFIQRLKRPKDKDPMDLDELHNDTAELFRGKPIGKFLGLDVLWLRMVPQG